MNRILRNRTGSSLEDVAQGGENVLMKVNVGGAEEGEEYRKDTITDESVDDVDWSFFSESLQCFKVTHLCPPCTISEDRQEGSTQSLAEHCIRMVWVA